MGNFITYRGCTYIYNVFTYLYYGIIITKFMYLVYAHNQGSHKGGGFDGP